ncbi:MAG: FkbM family methyltransferase [Phycisphaerales bacterium]|nr:FkbM family methyltransferase [Phycisphaerales bacterium]
MKKQLKRYIKELISPQDRLFRKVVGRIARKPDFKFVQIGSNDGKRADPLYPYIRKHGWSGIMVEPVPYLFERLKANHAGRDNLTLRNVAVSSEGGVMTFYYFKEHGDQTDWTSGNGLGSFNREHAYHVRSQIPGFEENLTEMEIETITFTDLVEGLDHIDLLHIDTEGYDFEIIKTIDFELHSPSAILYESACLNRFYKDEGAKAAARAYLDEKGYDCYEYGRTLDTLAILRGGEASS